MPPEAGSPVSPTFGWVNPQSPAPQYSSAPAVPSGSAQAGIPSTVELGSSARIPVTVPATSLSGPQAASATASNRNSASSSGPPATGTVGGEASNRSGPSVSAPRTEQTSSTTAQGSTGPVETPDEVIRRIRALRAMKGPVEVPHSSMPAEPTVNVKLITEQLEALNINQAIRDSQIRDNLADIVAKQNADHIAAIAQLRQEQHRKNVDTADMLIEAAAQLRQAKADAKAASTAQASHEHDMMEMLTSMKVILSKKSVAGSQLPTTVGGGSIREMPEGEPLDYQGPPRYSAPQYTDLPNRESNQDRQGTREAYRAETEGPNYMPFRSGNLYSETPVNRMPIPEARPAYTGGESRREYTPGGRAPVTSGGGENLDKPNSSRARPDAEPARSGGEYRTDPRNFQNVHEYLRSIQEDKPEPMYAPENRETQHEPSRHRSHDKDSGGGGTQPQG